MTFMIAAAGTGGHVFPGLAVGEALVALGVARDDVLYVGGDRLESKVYPEAGFPFLGLEMRGLQRSLAPKNLGLPRLVWRARDTLVEAINERSVQVALGMGGYVTIPTALACKKSGTTLFIAEQNAGAGLANRVASRWAKRCFIAFPDTEGLERGEWVGNPVRKELVDFDRDLLRPEALARYRLSPGQAVLGVFGGSLGAGAINTAIREMVLAWDGPPVQLVHLTGRGNQVEVQGRIEGMTWCQVEFEERMELFYAACDLVVARAGGGVAELTATGTPSILIPGEFGSSGHQSANARFLAEAGAAVVLLQDRLGDLAATVMANLFDQEALGDMRRSALRVAKPGAAGTIAGAMLEAVA